MRPFTIGQFASACGGTLFGPESSSEQRIQGVTVDSRQVSPGSLFIATIGERSDGHDYIKSAFEKGAVCVVSQKELLDAPGPYLLVKDSLQALKEAAEAYRKTFDIPVIGVTGSVGKTSTKEMIASVLGQHFSVLKTPGNFNNEIGVPLTLFLIEEEHEAAVLEMGMNHFGEMHRLSKMVRPTHCVFTNIGVAHLEFLGSRDGILKAKAEMFDYARKDASVFLNGDDDKLITLQDQRPACTFGLSPARDLWADQIESLGLEGIRCRIHGKKGASMEAAIPLPGIHMGYNALAGTSVGLSLGLTMEEIRTGIEKLKPIRGRSNILHTDRYTLLDDCYNSNPVSMCAMLDVLNDTPKRKVAILGDMGELGQDSEKLHASVGEHLKGLQIDAVITIGSLSLAIHEAAKKAAPDALCLHYDDSDAFLREASRILMPGDAVLIKASHYMGFERIVSALSS